MAQFMPKLHASNAGRATKCLKRVNAVYISINKLPKSDLRGEMKSWCTAGGAALTTTGYISVKPKINGDRLTSQIC